MAERESRKVKVYVAGRYSSDKILEVFNNIRKGQRLATEVLLAGFIPFCPWFDYPFQLNLREGEELTPEDYYSYSIEWLNVCDCMLLVEGWEESSGTAREIKVAMELGIPIMKSINELIGYYPYKTIVEHK